MLKKITLIMLTFVLIFPINNAKAEALPDLVITDLDYYFNTQTIDGKKYTVANFTLIYKNESTVDLEGSFYACAESASTSQYPNGYKECFFVSNTAMLPGAETSIANNFVYRFPSDDETTASFTFYLDEFLSTNKGEEGKEAEEAEKSNLLREANEGNNQYSKTVLANHDEASDLPDLIVTDIEIIDDKIRVNFQNIGGKSTDEEFELKIVDANDNNLEDNKKVNRRTIEGIASGAEAYEEFELDYGVYYFIVDIDYFNTVKETDNANNRFTKKVVFEKTIEQKPDLIISKAELVDNVLTIKYYNQGTTSSNEGFKLQVRELNNNILENNSSYVYRATSTGSKMEVGEERSEKIILKEGKYNLAMKIDVDNLIPELNENNNILLKEFTVGSVVEEIKEEEKKEEENISNTNTIKEKARLLKENKIEDILKEINGLKDTVKEQENKIKYLEKLTKDYKKLASNIEDAINNFITYGVDSNTKKLGEGERAAVIYSYKKAYNKLPETETELEDAIRIASGRWPGNISVEAENRAKEQFIKIYKKVADMDNPRDSAAVTVMAYGLRQKAENRNLDSEKQGIKTFKAIYGHHPNSTEDWNIMQAITYSGASRGVDTDGDLLIDEREEKLGTDPNNKDTDGDGYLDGMEVSAGYDPLK